MLVLSPLLLIAALVLFVMAAAGIAAIGRVGVVPAGLACWAASQALPLLIR